MRESRSFSAFITVVNFYVVEALLALVSLNAQYGIKSQEKLELDIREYQKKLVKTTKEKLYDYNASVVFGELRHSYSKTTEGYSVKGVPVGGSRSGSYGDSEEYDPLNVLKRAEEVFYKGSWSYNYGGDKWGFISNRAQLVNIIPDKTFCDMCFSLSHNSSPYLDKEDSRIFQLYETTDYKNFLDAKFELTVADLLRDHLRYLSTSVLNFAKRAMTLGFFDGFDEDTMVLIRQQLKSPRYNLKSVDVRYEYDVRLLNYEKISWGKKKLGSLRSRANYRKRGEGKTKIGTYVTITQECSSSYGKNCKVVDYDRDTDIVEVKVSHNKHLRFYSKDVTTTKSLIKVGTKVICNKKNVLIYGKSNFTNDYKGFVNSKQMDEVVCLRECNITSIATTKNKGFLPTAYNKNKVSTALKQLQEKTCKQLKKMSSSVMVDTPTSADFFHAPTLTIGAKERETVVEKYRTVSYDNPCKETDFPHSKGLNVICSGVNTKIYEGEKHINPRNREREDKENEEKWQHYKGNPIFQIGN